jgi:hypothetical protein
MSTENKTAKAEASAKIINKISTKTIVGKIKAPESAEALYKVYGIATKVVHGETAFGAFVAFLGDFKAVNLKTNEVVRSGKCFLPDVAANMLQGALEHSDSGVEFGFVVNAEPADNQSGYQYTVSPLIESNAADPMSLLEKRLLSITDETTKAKK